QGRLQSLAGEDRYRLNGGSPRMLQARPHLDLDVQAVVDSIEIALVAVDEMDAAVAVDLRRRDIIINAEQHVLCPGFLVLTDEFANVRNRTQHRAHAAYVLHLRKAHARAITQLCLDRWKAFEALCYECAGVYFR